MALSHAQPAQAWSVAPFGELLGQQRSVALFKSTQLEVIRLVLLDGRSMPIHHAPGDVTIQCIEGELDVRTQELSTALHPGQLLYLRAHQAHAITARRAASALLTFVLRPGQAQA